jgi:putative alpha-1,2-mannosidase
MTESSIQASSPYVTSDFPVSLVNLFQGNDSMPVFSRGNTLPIAARPFGMTHWTLQSHANAPWMFSLASAASKAFVQLVN